MTSRETVRHLGDDRDGVAAVDERQLVLVQRVDDELRPDEAEHHRQAVGEMDEPYSGSVGACGVRLNHVP
jgi:hypothetical protein